MNSMTAEVRRLYLSSKAVLMYLSSASQLALLVEVLIYRYMSSNQNSGYLLYIRDYTTLPSCIGIIISHEIMIPKTQSGFNGMSCQGFWVLPIWMI